MDDISSSLYISYAIYVYSTMFCIASCGFRFLYYLLHRDYSIKSEIQPQGTRFERHPSMQRLREYGKIKERRDEYVRILKERRNEKSNSYSKKKHDDLFEWKKEYYNLTPVWKFFLTNEIKKSTMFENIYRKRREMNFLFYKNKLEY